jgi:uncharacterized protein (TIRG00374 family)
MRRWWVVPASVLLLGLVVWQTRPWEIGPLWGRLDLGMLGLALLLDIVVVSLWAIRSGALMRAVGHPLPWAALIPVVSFANMINNLTPASSGEILRAFVLRERHDVPYARSAAVILLERFWAIGVMALTAAAAAAGPLLHLPSPLHLVAWGVAVAGCFLPSLLYVAGFRPAHFLDRLRPRVGTGRTGRIVRILAEVDDSLAEVLTRPSQALRFVVATGLIFACFAVQLTAVLAALDRPISIEGAWAALGLATIAGVLSALPFGLGAADAVLAILLTAQGVPPAVAGAAALILRAVTTLPLGIAGAASSSWLFAGRRPRDVPAGTLFRHDADPGAS